MKNLILMGFKSCGKTTWGLKISQHLNRPFYDTDKLIQEQFGQSPRQIELEYGPAYFLDCERKIVMGLENVHSSIIALGGRTILDSQCHASLAKNGYFIYLKVESDILKNRIFSQSELPSFLRVEHPEKKFQELFTERSARYEELADLVVTGVQMDSQVLIRNLKNYGK